MFSYLRAWSISVPVQSRCFVGLSLAAACFMSNNGFVEHQQITWLYSIENICLKKVFLKFFDIRVF